MEGDGTLKGSGMNNRPPVDPSQKEKRTGGPNGDSPDGNNPSPLSNPNAMRLWGLISVVVIIIFLFAFMGNGRSPSGDLSLNDLYASVQKGEVASITERGGVELEVVYKDNRTARAYKS